MYAGDDRRVTASADIENNQPNMPFSIVSAENHNWTGIYDSATGNLLTYLVSGLLEDKEAARNYAPAIDSEGNVLNTDQVILVGSGSIDLANDIDSNGMPDDAVVVPKEPIYEGQQVTGSYGWWIGDEGLKARYNLKGKPIIASELPSDRGALAAFPRADLRVVESMSLFPQDSSRVLEIASENEIALLSPQLAVSSRNHFHDFTTFSTGLLTNTRDGGLKRDMSLAFEMSDANFNTSDHFAGNENIPYVSFAAEYVFSEEISDGAIVHGPTWHLLRNFYRQYKDVYYDGSIPSIRARADSPLPNSYHADNNAGHQFGFDNRVKSDPLGMDTEEKLDYNVNSSVGPKSILRVTDAAIAPVVTHIEYLFSLRLRPVNPARETPPDQTFTYAVDLVWDPVVTVWNPYNVNLEFTGLKIHPRAFPLRFDFGADKEFICDWYDTAPRKAFSNIKLEQITGNTSGRLLDLVIGSGSDPIVLAPGEIKVYSPGNTSPQFYSDLVNSSSPAPIVAQEGWNSSGGVAIPLGITGDDMQSMWIRLEDAGDALIQSYLVTDWSRKDRSPDPDITQPEICIATFPRQYLYNASLDSNNLYPVAWVQNGGAGVDTDRGSPKLAPDLSTWYRFANLPIGAKFIIARFDVYLKSASDTEAIAHAGFSNIRARNSTPLIPRQEEHSFPVPAWRRKLDAADSVSAVNLGQGNRGFWGPDNASGESFVSIYEVPTAPLTSLGQLMHANIGMRGHDALHPVGNSFASPYLPKTEKVAIYRYKRDNSAYDYPTYVPDYSYLMNEALWDGYFFSSISPKTFDVHGTIKDVETVYRDFARGEEKLANSRLRFAMNTEQSIDSATASIASGNQIKADAYDWSAVHLTNEGAFNVNSTSVDAWAAILGGLREGVVRYFDSESGSLQSDSFTEVSYPFGKFTMPNGTSEEAWRGFSRLSDGQIKVLAGNIVDQVRRRGPFMSMADFVNRSLTDDEYGLGGALQSAIWESQIDSLFPINANPDFLDESTDLSELDFLNWDNQRTSGGQRQKVALGMAGYLTQADILVALGSMLTVRSDTFRIRSYGEVLNPITNEVSSEAWLEAIVQRTIEPVVREDNNPANLQYYSPSIGNTLGRKFKIISFRWLDSEQI
ncbi:hypothetical protein GCM10007047_17610 [Cerasicoccus arenae]|uniref:Uncharacterized protein n=2 Tax=Cerasicoccus arenae TaxID=424488 RepID=A0A8J3DH69_9BACT|nr:hypothetical protein GCM10007047_17610 [Cerasicoccus arenae]